MASVLPSPRRRPGSILVSGISDDEILLVRSPETSRLRSCRASITIFFVRNIQPAAYILANRMRGTLYIGVTSDLIQRVWQHRQACVEGFTSRHHVHLLVWYETHPTMECAIRREKALKEWKRLWKLRLIEESNPNWDDLYPDML